MPRKAFRGKEPEIEARMDAKGKDTAQLFLFAMESSGTGPPRGMMTLVDHRGAAAFLRAVQNHLSVDNTFCRPCVQTISEYAKENIVPDDIASGKTWNTPVSKAIEYEAGIPICKVSVNPLLLFLHLDQGCFGNPGYTPFASPIANSWSIYQDHVNNICKQVEKGEAIITQEDLAIIPFDVCLDGHNDKPASLPYRCTLNRDKQSDATVIGKKAVASTKQALDFLYQKVSC